MTDEEKLREKVEETKALLGGRPLNPTGSELLGGNSLSSEAEMLQAMRRNSSKYDKKDDASKDIPYQPHP